MLRRVRGRKRPDTGASGEFAETADPVPECHTWDKRSHRSYHLIDNNTH